jgi:hypothetical protein
MSIRPTRPHWERADRRRRYQQGQCRRCEQPRYLDRRLCYEHLIEDSERNVRRYHANKGKS